MSSPQTGPDLSAAGHLLKPYGNYVLVRKLAEGGMAEIFLAKLLGADGFERNVVIKRMLAHLSSIPDFVEMFRDEARLAAKLSHPNIIQIHELGFIDECYYICMEYLAGEDFSSTLRQAGRKRQYTPLPIVLRVLADAARGLHYAHDFTNEEGKPLNIVHRDISPSNLYVTYQGQVKVLDFGIAKAESRLVQTRTGVVKGKYIYMAPEQARGAEVDRRADVFSLGVSLYESVTNVRPFARENDLAVLNALLQGDFARPTSLRRELPPELEAVILKAMALSPGDRYATAGEFADAVERCLAGRIAPATNKELADYLRLQFGEERVAGKTRIPTLASLSSMSSQAAPSSPPRPVVFASSGQLPTAQLPLRGSAPSPAAPEAARSGNARRPGLLLGGVAGLLVLVAGGGVLAWRGLKPEPVASPPEPSVALTAPPETAQVEPAPPAVAPTPDASAAVAPTEVPPPGEAPPTEAQPVVATAVPVPAEKAPPKETVKGAKSRLVTLGIEDIERVVARGRDRIATCFDRHKAHLPSDTGVVRVQLSIAGSGRVKATTQGPLASKPVGQCLESQAERLRFPAHRDQEVNVVLPFDYTVTR
jgi:serine/threonine protein kinase